MKSLSPSKIRTKLLSGFALVAVLAGAIGMVGDINMKMLDDRDGSLYAKATVSLSSLGNASAKFHDLVLLNQKLRTDNSPESFTAASGALAGRSNAIEKDLLQYASIMADSSSTTGVNALAAACRKYADDTKEYYRLGVDGQLFEAKKFHHAVLGADNSTVGAEFLRMTDANLAQTERGREENSDILESMRRLMFILVGIAIAVACGLGVYLTIVIGRQFRQQTPADASLAEQDGALYAQTPAAMNLSAAPEAASAVLSQTSAAEEVLRPKPRKSESKKQAAEILLSAPVASLRSATDAKLSLAPAMQNQPAKKMRLYFDDTIEYVETERLNYR
jgi:hypothetical protein